MLLPPFVRRLRLLSGLVLLTFVLGHLINLALALDSIEAMNQARDVLLAPWRTLPGSVLLAGSMLVHAALGLITIGSRRSFALSRTDWVQMLLGVLTVPLLVNHIALVGVFKTLNQQFQPDYGLLFAIFWKYMPANALLQVVAVVAVWVHGAIGLYSWLVLRPVWRRIGPLVTPLLFLVPIAALLGFAQGGKDVMVRLAGNSDWQTKIADNMALILSSRAEIESIRNWMLLGYSVLALLAFAIFIRRALHTRAQPVPVLYDGGASGLGRRGLSILEVSLLNHLPHAHVCSGRARCGTCLIEVNSGAEALTPVLGDEAATLHRVHAAPGQRLACQARLTGGPVEVTRLRPAYADASASRNPEEWTPVLQTTASAEGAP
jgi:adenylate cyclase